MTSKPTVEQPADSLETRLLRLTHCDRIEEVWTAHLEAMALYGFDRLLYGFTRFWSGYSFGDPDDFLVLTNLDPAYTERFIGEGMYREAPMARWALHNEGACSWSVLQQMSDAGVLSDTERKIIEFNRTHGLTAGYSISFRSVSRRSKGAIALMARDGMSQAEVDAVWEAHGDEIQLFNNILHLKVLTLPYTPPNQMLTPRQREALEWVGDGKTTADIATIMGLTSATVEKHLRLARAALNVETTAQAVLKAAFQNQMFVVDLDAHQT
ncbi:MULTISPECIES: LuxR family transcriptional regulator [unclassified Roseivivax]|uniref:LuxR family transcriptional regulator n=1 Tax=Roseivivax sp. GX 12232 TaxID=2900547 RepID=UPI001E4F2451|nr:LuxR family transcriptional regulator [Roseivivax sp. GX 12232]MCE0504754.1 LuxR family transcriptional regulator [Roseivivax sp. GX 12232]